MTGGRPEDVVQATVEDVVFRSEDGRYAVVRMAREPKGEPLVAVGELGPVALGESLRLRGRFTEHATFGTRFQVSSFTPVLPTSADGIARYLGSGLVPGVGRKLADKLVAKFGARTLDVITTESERMREVRGLGRGRAQAIAQAVQGRRDEAESMAFLSAVGLGPSLSRKVLQKYGASAARVLRDDPYLVAEQVPGVGFRTADRIGRSSGMAADDPRRAAGAVLHLVAQAADEGHTFATKRILEDGADSLEVPPARIAPAIETLASRLRVVVEDDAVYAPPLFRAETEVARALVALARPRKPPPGLARIVQRAADAQGLSEEQRAAVTQSFSHGLLVVTGGPGTGKTTTVRALLTAHRAVDHRVMLLAPTGRAAKRLAETTGAEARTIHRALEWNPRSGGPQRDEDNPFDVDLLLVDEASMLDVQLARSLLAAVAPSTVLVLVGDVDQLPPVSAGPVLREVIASQAVPVVRLNTIFRQAQASYIVRGAHEILHGRAPTPTPSGTRGDGDLFVVKASEPDRIADVLLRSLTRMGPAYGLDPVRDVQVLGPMRRGPLGTERLNALLQEHLNPGAGTPGAMRAGDKVMQLRNDYDRDVFNGDLGEVSRIVGGTTHVMIDGRELQYAPDELDALGLAYATTIHKSQGSEFPAVVVVLHASHHVLLDRALLYTAVTRARKLVVIVGDERALKRAAAHAEMRATRSRLADRLRSAIAAEAG